jgi:hypothetical protein
MNIKNTELLIERINEIILKIENLSNTKESIPRTLIPFDEVKAFLGLKNTQIINTSLVGLYEKDESYLLMCGPPSAIKKHCIYYVVIEPSGVYMARVTLPQGKGTIMIPTPAGPRQVSILLSSPYEVVKLRVFNDGVVSSNYPKPLADTEYGIFNTSSAVKN